LGSLLLLVEELELGVLLVEPVEELPVVPAAAPEVPAAAPD